jgi:hypothetical protein
MNVPKITVPLTRGVFTTIYHINAILLIDVMTLIVIKLMDALLLILLTDVWIMICVTNILVIPTVDVFLSRLIVMTMMLALTTLVILIPDVRTPLRKILIPTNVLPSIVTRKLGPIILLLNVMIMMPVHEMSVFLTLDV